MLLLAGEKLPDDGSPDKAMTAIRTSLIVRLARRNRMVTKGYRKGVYEWVKNSLGKWEIE